MYQDLASLERYPKDDILIKRNGDRIRTPKQLCLWYPSKSKPKRVEVTSQQQSFGELENLVLKYGQCQWFSFGKLLGFSMDETEGLCYNKPTPAEKLGAIISEKQKQIGLHETRELLLAACKRVPSPIYGIVKDNLNTQR
jgi:hypothetical protein